MILLRDIVEIEATPERRCAAKARGARGVSPRPSFPPTYWRLRPIAAQAQNRSLIGWRISKRTSWYGILIMWNVGT